MSQQLFSAAFLSNLSQRLFSAGSLSSSSQQLFSASSALQPFSAAFLRSLSQQPFSTALVVSYWHHLDVAKGWCSAIDVILLWSWVGGHLALSGKILSVLELLLKSNNQFLCPECWNHSVPTIWGTVLKYECLKNGWVKSNWTRGWHLPVRKEYCWVDTRCAVASWHFYMPLSPSRDRYAISISINFPIAFAFSTLLSIPLNQYLQLNPQSTALSKAEAIAIPAPGPVPTPVHVPLPTAKVVLISLSISILFAWFSSSKINTVQLRQAPPPITHRMGRLKGSFVIILRKQKPTPWIANTASCNWAGDGWTYRCLLNSKQLNYVTRFCLMFYAGAPRHGEAPVMNSCHALSRQAVSRPMRCFSLFKSRDLSETRRRISRKHWRQLNEDSWIKEMFDVSVDMSSVRKTFIPDIFLHQCCQHSSHNFSATPHHQHTNPTPATHTNTHRHTHNTHNTQQSHTHTQTTNTTNTRTRQTQQRQQTHTHTVNDHLAKVESSKSVNIQASNTWHQLNVMPSTTTLELMFECIQRTLHPRKFQTSKFSSHTQGLMAGHARKLFHWWRNGRAKGRQVQDVSWT